MLTRIEYLVTLILTQNCVTNNGHELSEAEHQLCYNEGTESAFLRGRKFTQNTR